MKKPAKPISPAPADQEATYPTRDWQVPASDNQGHGERISVRVPTGMAHLINLAVESHQYPWKQPAECIRWCIDYGLKHLRKQSTNPEFKSVHTTLNIFRRSQATQMEMLNCSRHLVEMKENLDRLIKEGALPAAARILEGVKADLHEVEDPYWKKRFREAILTYTRIIEEAPGDKRFTAAPVVERREVQRRKGNGK